MPRARSRCCSRRRRRSPLRADVSRARQGLQEARRQRSRRRNTFQKYLQLAPHRRRTPNSQRRDQRAYESCDRHGRLAIVALVANVAAGPRKVLVLPRRWQRAERAQRAQINDTIVKLAKTGSTATSRPARRRSTRLRLRLAATRQADVWRHRAHDALRRRARLRHREHRGWIDHRHRPSRARRARPARRPQVTVDRAATAVRPIRPVTGDSEPLFTQRCRSASGSDAGSRVVPLRPRADESFFDSRERKLGVALAVAAVDRARHRSLAVGGGERSAESISTATRQDTRAQLEDLHDARDRAGSKALWGNICVVAGARARRLSVAYYLWKDHKNRSSRRLTPAPHRGRRWRDARAAEVAGEACIRRRAARSRIGAAALWSCTVNRVSDKLQVHSADADCDPGRICETGYCVIGTRARRCRPHRRGRVPVGLREHLRLREPARARSPAPAAATSSARPAGTVTSTCTDAGACGNDQLQQRQRAARFDCAAETRVATSRARKPCNIGAPARRPAETSTARRPTARRPARARGLRLLSCTTAPARRHAVAAAARRSAAP